MRGGGVLGWERVPLHVGIRVHNVPLVERRKVRERTSEELLHGVVEEGEGERAGGGWEEGGGVLMTRDRGEEGWVGVRLTERGEGVRREERVVSAVVSVVVRGQKCVSAVVRATRNQRQRFRLFSEGVGGGSPFGRRGCWSCVAPTRPLLSSLSLRVAHTPPLPPPSFPLSPDDKMEGWIEGGRGSFWVYRRRTLSMTRATALPSSCFKAWANF